MQESQLQLNYEDFKKYYKNLPKTQQAGSLLWPSLQGDTLTEEEKFLFQEIKPSGVVLFKRSFSNIQNSKNLIHSLTQLCKRSSPYASPFIVAADEEGGRVSRIPLKNKTKPVLSFVQEKNKKGLKKQVEEQIFVAKALGINCFLAPVLDIFTEPENKVIGDRSFGQTAEEVCEYAQVVYDALLEQNILPCGKHFPGHGNTKADSHLSSAISDIDEKLLFERELVPFEYFIELNIPMIMAAHIILPRLKLKKNDNTIPVTLNSELLNEILRNKLRFKGLIVSDDLQMGAIKTYYENKGIKDNYLKYAGVDALKAGCDILLSCQSITEERIIIDAIIQNMEDDLDFFDLCCEKVYRQTQMFQTYFSE